jgi:hypothetical protein
MVEKGFSAQFHFGNLRTGTSICIDFQGNLCYHPFCGFASHGWQHHHPLGGC